MTISMYFYIILMYSIGVKNAFLTAELKAEL